MSHTQEYDHVETSQGSGWRIAGGKIVRGRQGEEEVRPAVLGYLRRIGTHYGQIDSGERYGKLEADIETSSGMERVGTSILSPRTGKPSLWSSITFAEALLELAKDEYCQIEAYLSSKPNTNGGYNTYVKGFHVDPKTRKPKQTARVERERDRSLEEYLDELLQRLESHPAFAARPGQGQADDQEDPYAEELEEKSPFGEDTGSHSKEAIAARAREAFDTAAQKKGWPSLKEAPTEYLELMNGFSEKVRSQTKTKPFAHLDHVDGEWWKELTDTLPTLTNVPKLLQPALDRRRQGGDASVFA